MSQYFKGDAQEVKMVGAIAPAFDLTSAALDDFFSGGSTASDFLLMLYDAGRMPFADRVPRDAFVAFIQQAIPNFRFTGTFESYIFILKSIFGEGTLVQFDVPAAGKITMVVSAGDATEFDLVVRSLVDGVLEEFNLYTMDGDQIQARGISGIESEAQLTALLAELIPAGIYPDITLQLFTLSDFIAEYSAGVFYQIVDHLTNQIIFFEPGE